jgi:hypothetical protein
MDATTENFTTCLRKGELKALLSCASKDPKRVNLTNVQFFQGAAAATNGHVALVFADKGFRWNKPDTSPHISARKCVAYEREGLEQAVKAAKKTSLIKISTETDEASITHVDRKGNETLACLISLTRRESLVPPVAQVIPAERDGYGDAACVIGWRTDTLLTVSKAFDTASGMKHPAMRFSLPTNGLDVTRIDHEDPTTDRTWTACLMPVRL